MSKIIKHTFEVPNLSVENGELIEGEPIKKTYTFTLLFKGVGVFEELYGKPLLNVLLSAVDVNDKVSSTLNIMDKKFIRDLACASYVKLDGDRFHNNRATAEEFKKTQAYPLVESDMSFIMDLVAMAMECVYQDQKSKAKSKEAIRPKK